VTPMVKEQQRSNVLLKSIQTKITPGGLVVF
jgi:hypothetical protein